ncbi:hypothetical protein J3B02_001017 [Coemansia erecta]|uniref:PAS domain-containing protein n=1 Tax=Coemansia asiatica TaxID=1052880 RepID=A0A9W8CIQ2_9FUNG|nr:hypothetical protein LPJ64_003515 [Coemansia asiatica]KAJ2857421.1 hypothetical protein J3B02_001017 [Coemansia erecta]KAJ2888079.1 hypothetical protein FB639_000885 [Coemansia asiatica]
MPISYVMIFERTGPENILYVSGNCHKVLGYTPEEMVGTSALNYSYDPHAKHYSCQWPADNPELGVTMLPHNLQRKDGTVIYVHAISINCTGHLFTIVVAYPELGDIRVQDSILYKLQYEVDYNYNSKESLKTLSDTESAVSTDTGNSDIIYPKYPKVTRESLQKAHVYTARACRAKACFVLKVEEQGGPVVEFVTNSISNVFNGHIDGHEIIDRPFLSIVDPKDMVKAAAFFQSLRNNHAPKLCSFGLLVDPFGGDSGVVQVELFGASSDDKFVLMCQKKRNEMAADQAPYMSLEEIISSDYESSDVNETWHQLLW